MHGSSPQRRPPPLRLPREGLPPFHVRHQLPPLQLPRSVSEGRRRRLHGGNHPGGFQAEALLSSLPRHRLRLEGRRGGAEAHERQTQELLYRVVRLHGGLQRDQEAREDGASPRPAVRHRSRSAEGLAEVGAAARFGRSVQHDAVGSRRGGSRRSNHSCGWWGVWRFASVAVHHVVLSSSVSGARRP